VTQLHEKSVAELETELRRLTSTSRMPPSAREQIFASYAVCAQIADATQRVTTQRTFLVTSIGAYQRPEMQLTPEERMPESELMRTALALAQRREDVENLLGEYDQATYAPEDRDFYRRLALAYFIKENAAAARTPEPGPPGRTIEVLNADELRCPRCGGEDVDNSQRLTPQSGNSGDYVTFACRACGYREEALDGDTPVSRCDWVKS